MSSRLKLRLAQRRKALVPVVATVLADVVFAATGVDLDVALLSSVIGVVVAAVVHETPNAPGV